MEITFSNFKIMKNLLTLLLYAILGFICLIIAGFTIRESIGFGIIFGLIEGILNEIHRDLIKNSNENGDKTSNSSKT